MDSRPVDLNLLAALDALLAERNVTRAARRLNISQPALSARLARLRSIFEDQLLIPSGRGMVPTQRALELQAPLRSALEQLHGVAQNVGRFDPLLARETISIAASDYMQSTLLIPLLVKTRRQAPLLRVALHLIDGARVWEQMERGDIDIALMTPETSPELVRSRPLWNEHYVCIARTGHPSTRSGMDLATFASLEHVVVSPRGSGFVGPADAALRKQGMTRSVVLSVNSFLLVPELVAQSNVIALVPERLIAKRSRQLQEQLQVFKPPIEVASFSIGMVWHDRTTASPSHRWLRKKIADAAK